MVLKELEIQGFKSFPDKIKVTIGRGITGVVGPNGSGKSNISDAIRWVLGETSSKQLRGSGKMEDVIFGGTQIRGAMGFASVRLTLDNTDRALDMDADEVVVGRKYYRSGESEYTLNGQVCRLKDVYELFLDTGLGRDGYSIIGQGRIAEIVGAKSNERREIFEEASGIAKYRYRKTEAEHRLASAEENLERLRDILGELESRVGPLAKDSAKAQKFLELSEQRKSLEVTLWVDNVRRAKDTVREQQHKYETAEADYNRLDEAEKSAEQEAEEIRAEAQRMTIEIERLNGDIRTITEQMNSTTSRIAVLENDIAHNEQNIQNLEAEIAEGEHSRENINGEIAGHEQAITEIEAAEKEIEAAIAAVNATLEKIQADSLASGERRGAVTAALAQMTEQQTACRVSAAGADSAAATAAQRLEEARAEGATDKESVEKLAQEQADTAAYLEKINENVTRLTNIRSGLTLKLAARRKSLDEADAAEQQIDRQIDAAEQRVQVLRELEKNMEGYTQSVKSVMRAAEAHRLGGVIGPVSSILSVEKGYETAIETALGGALQNIVVDSEAAAKAAIAFLRDAHAGRATFLPLDTIQPGVFHGELTGSAQLASGLVHCDAKYEGVVRYLLGRIVVVDEINEASGVARRLGYHNKIVTADGQVINAGGSFTGGSVSRSAGLFTRKQEIADLREKITKLQASQQQAQTDTDRWKAQVDALSAELTATESEAITAGNDKVRAETEAGRIATALSQARGAAEIHAGEIEQLEGRIAESRATAERQKAEEARLTAEIEKLSAELHNISAGDDSFLATRTRLSEELSQKKLEKLEKEKDAEAHRTAIENLQSRTEETSGRRAEQERSIAALRGMNEQNRAHIAEIENEKSGRDTEIKAKEAAIQQATQQRLARQQGETEANARARQAAEDREKMSQEMARLAERKTNAETEYDQTISKLWEEYQLSLTEAEKLCIPFESLAQLRADVQDLRNQIRSLGNVNVGAIEEFKEVKARYDTLHEQVTDVEKSKAELTRMITELAGQMKTIFTDNFRTINENFGRIFAELFGGGTASLYLDDENDVLETGIEIRVAPPGKVIKNLSALSGGEQALVAISIYFAILAVNPAPFCILDEIEAALDDANVIRYAQYLRRITDKTQFIVITHRRGTMEAADILYGVTMQEDGVSKLLRLDLENVDATLIS
ncbi:MAG: chromosome segregation protein SMC [Faecalibacterium sp.]|jgi:chromosome segregation protein|nr:chromosome segregation protein SMC [Faecalibacterium sp.]